MIRLQYSMFLCGCDRILLVVLRDAELGVDGDNLEIFDRCLLSRTLPLALLHILCGEGLRVGHTHKLLGFHLVQA